MLEKQILALEMDNRALKTVIQILNSRVSMLEKSKTQKPKSKAKKSRQMIGVKKFDISKISEEIVEILAKYEVPASIREKIFDCIRSNYDLKAVIPYVQSKDKMKQKCYFWCREVIGNKNR